jgi:hypothetical protein
LNLINSMNNNTRTSRLYWLIGNSIDGVCCHPRRLKMSEQELITYLETQFLIDFNASRGEFDFSIYCHQQGFRVRQLYGYYLQGQRKNLVAQVDYMTADSIDRVVRCGRSFQYYGPSSLKTSRCVFRFTLP